MSSTLALENQSADAVAEIGTIHQAGNPPSNKTFRAPGEQGSAKPAENLLNELAVDAENLSQRRAFLRLSENEASVIRELIPWAQAHAEKIAKELYDWQFEFPGTAKFLKSFGKRIGLSEEALRAKLEAEQTSYIVSIFEGALSSWGLEYFESRLRIGAANSKIDMPVKWQIGTYCELQRLLRRHLATNISNGKKLNEICDILGRLLNLDLQAIQDAFVMKLLSEFSVKIDEIVPDKDADRTEHLDQAKQALSALIAQAEALAGDRLHDPVLHLSLPAAGKMGEAILHLQDFLAEIADQAEVLVSGNLTSPKLDPLRNVGGFKVLSGSMSRLLKAQNQIASIATAVAAGDIDGIIETQSSKDVLATALNSMVGNVRRLVAELGDMAEAHARGEIDAVIHSESFQGAFRLVAQSVNQMVGEHITVNKKAIDCVSEFGKGNFEAPFEAQPGQRAVLNDVIEGIRANLKGLVSDLEKMSQAAAQKNLRVRLDANRHSGDYRKIMAGINSTIDAVTEPLRTTSDNANSLAQSAELLTTTSKIMANEAESTAGRADAVSSYSQEVSSRVSNVAASSEEMLSSIREISHNAHRAAQVAKSAVEVADTTNRTIGQLGESSREIGQVIKVITSIAQQTNLLALNATIEAARAGAAGQGFAVVATEVKELAKATANATEEISQKIEAIQSDTKSAVTAIAEVSAIITQINDISNSIASAVEEQTATTNEIGRNVHEAARHTDEITRGIAAVAESARETARGAADTQTAAQDLTQLAARMQGFVKNYEF